MRRGTGRRSGKNVGINLLGLAVIVLTAVVAGFLLTKFVVYPVMLGATDTFIWESREAEPSEDGKTTVSETQNGETTEPAKQTGYCIQFGSFTTRAAAEELLAQLTAAGIAASVSEKDGAYKVVGELFGDAEAARTALNAVDRTVYKDIFVTHI